MQELAPTILGSKPATVLSFANSRHFALLDAWKQYGTKLIAGSVLRYVILRQRTEQWTILFHRPDQLQRCLGNRSNRQFLSRCGYPSQDDEEACLRCLQERFQKTSCPHEIGLFLGIPLKDVKGYMGINSLSLTCRNCWYIYGNPEPSLSLIRRFAKDGQRVRMLLAQGLDPTTIFRGGGVAKKRLPSG